jgi:hypothetical protein
LRTELFDALLGERDDGVGRVVVFFEAERLPVEGTVDLLTLAREPDKLGLAFVVAGVADVLDGRCSLSGSAARPSAGSRSKPGLAKPSADSAVANSRSWPVRDHGVTEIVV